jgi:hypothetical protein
LSWPLSSTINAWEIGGASPGLTIGKLVYTAKIRAAKILAAKEDL